MPGIGEDIDKAMQQAAQFSRHSIGQIYENIVLQGTVAIVRNGRDRSVQHTNMNEYELFLRIFTKNNNNANRHYHRSP